MSERGKPYTDLTLPEPPATQRDGISIKLNFNDKNHSVSCQNRVVRTELSEQSYQKRVVRTDVFSLQAMCWITHI